MAAGFTLGGRIEPGIGRPAYLQIAEQLRAAIRRGELAPGDRLPSEAQMIAHYGVERMTVRSAVRFLADAGLVAGPAGGDVFVPGSAGRRLAAE